MNSDPYLSPGMVLLDRYRVDERLARGGFGEVYRAFDLRIERDVALKYVFQRLNLEILRNEVTILARNAERLKFIPNIYDHWQGVGEHAGYFIVMEFIEGDTLDKTRKIPWPGEAVADFLRILLRNLRDLHRSNIVHCDIKPVNIKATPPSDLSYQVPYRILDFGIAKQGDETTIQASSPHYAAPEQYLFGEVRLKLDQRADLYSLAATAYYLLTGKRPPNADRRYAAVYEDRDRDPLKPPGALVRDVPEELELALLAMLAIDRERRPPSAEAALELLDAGLAQAAADAIAEAPEPAVDPQAAQTADSSLPLITELTEKSLRASSSAPASSLTPAALPRGEAPSRLAPALPTEHEPLGAPPTRLITGPVSAGPRLEEIERHGKGVIACMAWAPDGQSLFVGTSLGVYLLPAQGGPCTLWRPTALPVRHVGPVLEGQGVLIVAGESAEVLSLSGAPMAAALPALRGSVLSARQGRNVATVDDATLRVYQLGTGVEEAAWRLGERLQGQVVALSADGQAVAIGDGDRLWCHGLRTDLRERRWSIGDLPQPIVDLALSADGEVVAIAGPARAVVWARGDEAPQSLAPEAAPIARVALTSDGQTLAVATAAAVRRRRASDGRALAALAEADLADAQHLAFCPNDRLLAAASADEVRIWRLRDGALQHREGDWAQAVGALALLPAGAGVLAAGPRLQRWGLDAGRLVPGPALPGAPAGPYAAAAAGGLAAGTGASGPRVVELASGRERFALAAPPAQAHSLAFSPAGDRLFVVGADAVEAHDAATGAALARVPLLDRRAIEHVALDAGAYAAVQSRGKVTIFALEDGAERCAVQPRGGEEITAIALSADGALLLTAQRESLALWRIDGDRAYRLHQHPLAPGPSVTSLAFAADGAAVAAVRGSAVELWGLEDETLRPLGAAQGHNGPVEAAALLPDGLLASASRDGTLRLWRLVLP